MASIGKYFSASNILIFVVVASLLWALFYYSGTKGISYDAMTSDIAMNGGSAGSIVGITPDGEQTVRNSDAQSMGAPTVIGASSQAAVPVGGSKAYASQPVANPSDLLPSDKNNAWTSLNPNSNVNQVVIPDLLEAGYHIGLDTIGQTLKNPNLQERSEPIIPKQNVSPWNNSSYEPDIARVPLEIGYGCN
jgi:hypothetical protein